jgi:hypothetical protein
MLLDSLAFVLGGLCILGALDRLRLVNWKTTRPLYVLMYLAFCLWSLWIVKAAYNGQVQWYQLLGVAAALAWLAATHKSWHYGPPQEASRPMPLDAARHQ